MGKGLVKPGALMFLLWFVLVIPSIRGYLEDFTLRQFFKSYLFGAIAKGYIIEPIFLALIFLATFVIYIWVIIYGVTSTSSSSILGWTAMFSLVLIFMFPFICQDILYYIATGQVQFHYQANPYFTPPRNISDWQSDPLLSSTGWGFLVHVYGPIWAKVSAWVVNISGSNLWLAGVMFKILAALVHLTNTWLIGITAAKINLNTSRAMLIYGWNPLLLFELAGHAHNDALLLTFLILSIYFTCTRIYLALPSLTLAAMVKYTTLIVLPFFVMMFIKSRKIKELFVSILLSLAVLLLSWIPYWQGLNTLSGLVKQMNTYSIKSLHFLSTQGVVFLFPHIPKDTIFYNISMLLNLVFMAFIIYLLTKLLLSIEPLTTDKIINYSLLAIIAYLFIANKWFQPWYLSWAIPLASLLDFPHSSGVTVLLLSLTAELSRIPQMIAQNLKSYIQLATFLIAWFPLIIYFSLTNLIKGDTL